jgi:hypothetical protein
MQDGLGRLERSSRRVFWSVWGEKVAGSMVLAAPVNRQTRCGASSFQAHTWMGWRNAVVMGMGRQSTWNLARNLADWEAVTAVVWGSAMMARMDGPSPQKSRFSWGKSLVWVRPEA